LRILLDQARMAEREAEQELWDHVHLHHCPEVRVAVSQVA
jgi:hypothetical protein